MKTIYGAPICWLLKAAMITAGITANAAMDSAMFEESTINIYDLGLPDIGLTLPRFPDDGCCPEKTLICLCFPHQQWRDIQGRHPDLRW